MTDETPWQATEDEWDDALLPPYLRPAEQNAPPMGTISYNRRSRCWVVKGDPAVTEMCKRLFPGTAGARRGEARFTAHRRMVADMCWLMMRYPLEVKLSDLPLWDKAVAQARQYAIRQAKSVRMPARMNPPEGAFTGTLMAPPETVYVAVDTVVGALWLVKRPVVPVRESVTRTWEPSAPRPLTRTVLFPLSPPNTTLTNLRVES